MSELKSGVIPHCQPFQQLGKFLRKHDLVDVTRDHFIRQACFSTSYVRKLEKKLKHTESLEAFIDSLEGFKKIRLSTVSTAVTDFTYKGRDVLSITWIPPWAAHVYEISSYLQLDCSFRATRPAAYCVPQAIIRNFAVPLGFIVTPTESEKTYTWFMKDLQDLFVSRGEFVKKPVLSDQGSGLKKFCENNGYKHYFCHRHLIEKWGANGHLGMLVARALREQSWELFRYHLPALEADAQAICDLGLITPGQHEKFTKFLDVGNQFPHGIWHRIAEGVSSCSNHAERFHGVINQHLEGKISFVERLCLITEQIQKRWKEYPLPRYHFRQLKDAVAALRKCNAQQRDACDCQACLAYRAVMNSRFGIRNFPCRHTLSSWSIKDVPPMPALSLQPVDNRTVDPEEPVVKTKPPPLASLPAAAATGAQKTKGRLDRQVTGWTEAEEVNESQPPLDSSFPWNDLVDRELVIRITNGALFLRRRSKRLEPFDRDSLLLTIGTHCLKTMEVERPALRDPLRWFANYSAQWWAWAQSGKNQPQLPIRRECQ
jgi:hypothetical protein